MGSLLRTCSGFDLIAKNTYVKDVFNITYYIGKNSNSTVDNTFDMTSGNYLVKIKNKDSAMDHVLFDTYRGVSKELYKNKPSSEFDNVAGLVNFLTKGFTIGNSLNINKLNDVHSVITFKEADKFFDIVEYIGDGTTDRSISHVLGCDVGMISIKAIDIYSNWIVRHKDAAGELLGEQNYAQANSFTQITDITPTHFKVSNNANLIGINYIAYLNAHDSLSTGKIQCGSYVGGYQEVKNKVIGKGTFDIPNDVKEITITCSGGTGGSNIWYDPGQPYVPGTNEQKYIAPTFGWTYFDDYSITAAPITSLELWNSFVHTRPPEPEIPAVIESNPNDPSTSVYVEWWEGTMNNPVFYKGHYSSYLIDVGQPFIAGVEEQSFTAPSTGGNVYSGGYSKVVINGYTHVFEGGSAGKATPVTKHIVLDNIADRKVGYEIAVGGNLSYTYKTGGPTEIVFEFTLPAEKFEVELNGKGSIEIPIGVTDVTIVGKGGLGSNDTYISKGQPLIEATYLVEGQPYIAYDPGQPYIAPTAAVAGQEYIADTRWSTPAQTTPRGWRYDDYYTFAYSYWTQYEIYSPYVEYDLNDFEYNSNTTGPFLKFSYLAPGDVLYYHDFSTNTITTQVAGTVGPETQRTFYSRKVIDTGTAQFTTKQTWYEATSTPAASGGSAGQPYIAAVAANPGQPYIAPTPGQPYIAPVYLTGGQPYIAPTEATPGQPYIAPFTVNVPEKTVAGTWKYTDWSNLGAAYFSAIGVLTEEVKYESSDYVIFNQGGSNEYTTWSNFAPGQACYYSGFTAGPVEPVIKGYVPLATQRVWPRRWSSTTLGIQNTNVNQTWYPAVTTPAYSYTDPGQPYIAPTEATPGQPYIAASGGQPYIAPVYLNPGQPYIAPTPYDPGQPYIAAVSGQTYVAPTAEIKQEGNINYPNGLPAYVPGVTAIPSSPAKTIAVGWRYDKWDEYSVSYWSSLKITSRYLPYDPENYYESYDSVSGRYYRIYAHQPPGSNYFFVSDTNNTVIPDGVELAGQKSLETSIRFTCRYQWEEVQSSGATAVVTSIKTMDLTWFEEEVIPAVTGTQGSAQVGNSAYPDGLPPYVAYQAATTGRPYIAQVTGQPYIAPTPSSPGQPYIAPVIGKGDLLGESTHIAINNNMFTFPGALGWDTPVSYTNVLKLSGENSQTLVFNVASSGGLNISYDIPNSDVTTKANFKPYYLIIKKITGVGDWIEIDTKRSIFSMKSNKSDAEISNEDITIKADGIILNSLALNEQDQKYVYMVVRG